MLKLLDCAINEKRCCVDGAGRGICPLFRPHPGGYDSSRVPTPGNLPSKTQKMLMPGGQAGGGGMGRAIFVADKFFCFIFSDNLRPKSINVWKDLFTPTVPQINTVYQ